VNGGLDSRRDLLRQRAESRFVSDVSHELRNPITSMDLNLHLAEYGTPERRSYHLNAVRQATRQLEHLVEDALELSGLEANAAQERFAPEDLNLLVKNTVDAYRPYAVAAGLELFFEPGVNLPPVRAAYHRLVQVVTNLVVNAINYTPTGQVWVSTYLDTERERACLQVRDTGIGIDPGDLPHVFERFYRGLRATASDIPGTGLGLAIAKEIVDWHRGEIEVESRVDVGSTFRVWLPLDSHNGKRVTGKLR
jgi:signal transduction histidine kinase